MSQLKVRIPQTSRSGHCPHFSAHCSKLVIPTRAHVYACAGVYAYSYLLKPKPKPSDMGLPCAFWLHGGQCLDPLLISAMFSSRTGSGQGSCLGHLRTRTSFNTSACSEMWCLPPKGSSGVKVTAGDTGLAAKLLGQKNVYPVWYNPRILHVSPLRGGF